MMGERERKREREKGRMSKTGERERSSIPLSQVLFW